MTKIRVRSKKESGKKDGGKGLFLLSEEEFKKGVVFIDPEKSASRHPIVGVKMADGFYRHVG